MALYDAKDFQYYRNVRTDIITALGNETFNNVLELGAGGCDTMAYMKKFGLAQHVTALELFKIPGSNQESPLIDKLLIADLSDIHTLELPENHFDLIICGDVLEHIFNPWEIVLYIKRLLRPRGKIICSLPNIRFYRALINIFLKGDFKYSKDGILDMTHIRFFCKKNMVMLFRQNGYKINSILPGFKLNKNEGKSKVLNMLTFGIFQDFLAFQYILQASIDNIDDKAI